jgi:hypothetical protein
MIHGRVLRMSGREYELVDDRHSHMRGAGHSRRLDVGCVIVRIRIGPSCAEATLEPAS